MSPSSNGAKNEVAVEVEGRQLKLSNLDKVLYPEAGFTKGQVIDYYTRMAAVLVPHLQGRPVTLKRYPNGVDSQFFYEKNCPKHRPPWVATTPIFGGRKNELMDYCVVNDLPTLVWMSNLAALELHPSLSRAPEIKRPTMIVFDLDPGPPAALVECCQVALLLQGALDGLGLQSFPKTSGSKGLQIYVPLNGDVTYDDTKPFAHALARLLEAEHPGQVLSLMKKELRTGKVFIDWSQNDEHKTTVSIYSLRARPRPTVSTPVTWDEVDEAASRGDAHSLVFEAPAVLDRIAEHGDLFEPVLTLEQRLPDPPAA
ncbi:MAG: bifunctional non-ous end joining protein LigD [Actinomycetota bacterium]|jgi:bifunctional non-homologous end joining protein LigD|nr:bifunctional non-ous end joining protein LigD [Actinomycetota bacterium]